MFANEFPTTPSQPRTENGTLNFPPWRKIDSWRRRWESDARTNAEMCRYDLTENYSGMTAMIFGEIYRHNGEWKFNAIGQGTYDAGIGDLAQRYV